jgi:hypothetical protein
MVFTSSEDDHVSPFTLARFEELNGDDPMLRVWSDQLRALEPGDEVEIAWFTFRRVSRRRVEPTESSASRRGAVRREAPMEKALERDPPESSSVARR